MGVMNTVKMFDYWSFPDDGTVQFFQVCNGEVVDYRHYAKVENAPTALIGNGPELRYHGTAYIAPNPT
jgi:hypothetical protein